MVHIVHVTGRTNEFHSADKFSTLCGKQFRNRKTWETTKDVKLDWRRSFDPVTCPRCQKAFKKIESSVLDIVNFELDLDAFGATSPIPRPIVPRICITCGKMCPYWKGVRKNVAPWCTIWYASNRVEKLWDLKITTDHMRELTCERLQEIYEYIRFDDPVGVPSPTKFLTRLLTVMREKEMIIHGEIK